MKHLAISLIAASLAAGPVLAEDRALYSLHLQVFKNDMLVGSPALKVAAQTPASIAVGGENGYSLTTVVAPTSPGEPSPAKVSVSFQSAGQTSPLKFTVITPVKKPAIMTMQSAKDVYKFVIEVDAE